jgi:hypothetical protein
VAWSEKTSDKGYSEIYLRRWDGSAWFELDSSASLGGVSQTPLQTSFAPSLALDGSDYPVVAWADYYAGTYRILLRRWNGGAWTDHLGSGTGYGLSGSAVGCSVPSVALDPQGNPIVAWQQNTAVANVNQISLRQWTGAIWKGLGGSELPGGINGTSGDSRNPSLAQDPLTGNPVVAWDEMTSSGREIHLKKWSGVAWDEVEGSASGGGVSASYGECLMPALAIDAQGWPYVAYEDRYAGPEIYVRYRPSGTP